MMMWSGSSGPFAMPCAGGWKGGGWKGGGWKGGGWKGGWTGGWTGSCQAGLVWHQSEESGAGAGAGYGARDSESVPWHGKGRKRVLPGLVGSHTPKSDAPPAFPGANAETPGQSASVSASTGAEDADKRVKDALVDRARRAKLAKDAKAAEEASEDEDSEEDEEETEEEEEGGESEEEEDDDEEEDKSAEEDAPKNVKAMKRPAALKRPSASKGACAASSKSQKATKVKKMKSGKPMPVNIKHLLKKRLVNACSSREAFGCRGRTAAEKAVKAAGGSLAVLTATRSKCRTECIEFHDQIKNA